MQSIEVRHESSCYVGGIDEKVSEAVLWELFIQAGPVTSVYLPKDRLTNVHQGFAFVEMQTEEDADYAIKILNMIKLYNKPIRVNKASAHQKDMDVGANLFIGNLDPNVDEKTLYDVFSSFGVILSPPKIMKDPVTNESKGYGFINFASFESSDAAIEAMNGQFLENKQIHLQYAYKKEAKGERHGSIAERLLAAKNTNLATNQTTQPNAFFADGSNTENQPAGTENNVINLDTNNNMFNPMAGIMVNPIQIAPNMPFMFPNAPQFMPNTQFNLLPPPPGMPLPMMNQNSSSFNLQSTTPGDMSMNAPSQHSVSIPPPPPLNFQNNNMPLVSIQPSASPLPPPHNMPPVPNHDPNSINVHPLPPPPNLQNDIKNLPPTPLQNPNQNGSGTLPPPPQ